ncbi:MAG: Coenzyme F420 hydrogenase/dehydrogenase, beta subunit C-terminal domain [Duncaniella sp.]|nr:Coenzyme F420 hydrogenase/dehydrogenase, beta subunit C-terminal domain [Duncaniella sp.]
MNIDDRSQIRKCTSCQMCGAVCPTGAISIELNPDGFYRPKVDTDKCIDCGMCVRSCYKFDHDIRMADGFEGKSLYSAWARNPQVVESTTSGGVADLMARKLIERGYTCVGVVYDTESNRAVGKEASTAEDVAGFRGSKYIQSYSVEAFRSLVKNCRKEKYAVFGLPCQIYAVDRFLRAKGCREDHVLIDLYCHGCPSLNLWTKYVDEVVEKTGATKVLSVNFRSKIRGWGNFYVVVVVVVDGIPTPVTVVSPRVNDPFYTMFFSDRVLNDSCPDCKLRSTLEYTDIRLGDFWGDKFVDNHKGVSGVTVCGGSGMEVFDSISAEIECERQEFGSFIKYQSYGKDYRCDMSRRDDLLAMLADKDVSLKEVVAAYKRSLPLKARLILRAKNMIKLLPQGVISSVKGFVYKLRNK